LALGVFLWVMSTHKDDLITKLLDEIKQARERESQIA